MCACVYIRIEYRRSRFNGRPERSDPVIIVYKYRRDRTDRETKRKNDSLFVFRSCRRPHPARRRLRPPPSPFVHHFERPPLYINVHNPCGSHTYDIKTPVDEYTKTIKNVYIYIYMKSNIVLRRRRNMFIRLRGGRTCFALNRNTVINDGGRRLERM